MLLSGRYGRTKPRRKQSAGSDPGSEDLGVGQSTEANSPAGEAGGGLLLNFLLRVNLPWAPSDLGLGGKLKEDVFFFKHLKKVIFSSI